MRNGRTDGSERTGESCDEEPGEVVGTKGYCAARKSSRFQEVEEGVDSMLSGFECNLD